MNLNYNNSSTNMDKFIFQLKISFIMLEQMSLAIFI